MAKKHDVDVAVKEGRRERKRRQTRERIGALHMLRCDPSNIGSRQHFSLAKPSIYPSHPGSSTDAEMPDPFQISKRDQNHVRIPRSQVRSVQDRR